jgi:hypothetical protein
VSFREESWGERVAVKGEAGTSERLRVMVVDDHALFRRGLEMVLQGEDDLELVGEASTAPRRWRRPPSSCPTWS